ncbi:hypothetical protein [Mucilaginibacter sp. SG564]|uniref:hypothetical protein n=1 Tax=Mucilaginibacter sp. SG564 TaxID=2587022 RepID=UPI001553B793|nr:hypothetical protein [Mucilaginibacter sp. SG564]
MKTNETSANFLSRNLLPISLYAMGIFVALLLLPVFITENFIAPQIALMALCTSLFLGYLNYQHA